MFNRKIVLFAVTMLVIATFSCMKEKGTYDHQVINVVKIDTIKTKTVVLGAELQIEPVISQTLETGEDNLSYVWLWYKSGFVNADTLAFTRNLNYKIPIRTALGTYFTVLKVFDKKTGVFSKFTFNTIVTAPAAEGVLVLSDLNGDAEVGILNAARDYIGSLYYDANGSHPGKNPKSIGMIKVNSVPYLNGIIIMCDDGQGGVVANNIDFVKSYDYKKFFFVQPDVVKPQRYYNGITGLDARYDFIVNNNQLHVREYRGAQNTTEKTFFKPEMQPVVNKIAESAIVSGTTLLFYDNTNYKFVCVGVTSLQYLSKSFIPVFIGTQTPGMMPFDPNNVGLKLIYMAPGWKNLGYGIFKDPTTSQLYRLNFSISSLAFNSPFSAYYKNTITDAPGIEQASDYAYSLSDPYIYYSKENLLYRYDVEFDKTQAIYNLDTVVANSQIDKLYIRYYAGETQHSAKLVVASSEKSGTGKIGTLHALQLDRSGSVVKIDSLYKNVCGRVVSMDYKF